jgi:hypothetical protein
MPAASPAARGARLISADLDGRIVDRHSLQPNPEHRSPSFQSPRLSTLAGAADDTAHRPAEPGSTFAALRALLVGRLEVAPSSRPSVDFIAPAHGM